MLAILLERLIIGHFTRTSHIYVDFCDTDGYIFILSSGFFRIALAIPAGENGYSKCTMYDVNYTEVLSNGTREADPSWPTRGCSHGWEFNFTDIPYGTRIGRNRRRNDVFLSVSDDSLV